MGTRLKHLPSKNGPYGSFKPFTEAKLHVEFNTLNETSICRLAILAACQQSLLSFIFLLEYYLVRKESYVNTFSRGRIFPQQSALPTVVTWLEYSHNLIQ